MIMKELVVVLIIVHKDNPSGTEKASLIQCFKILKNYPIKLICPIGLNTSEYQTIHPEIQIDYIDPKWQANYRIFNRLKIDPFIYNRYRRYKFILFYELDAWVFRDELVYWCNKGYDYIGAPWLSEHQSVGEDIKFFGVGNGGFSLRKVKTHLRVLYSFSYVERLGYFYFLFRLKPFSISTYNYILQHLTVKNNTFYLFNTYQGNEDGFWGIIANRNFKWFNVAPNEIALRFSVEASPSKFINSVADLPFGCHAWERYELNFWRNFIVDS